MAEMGRKVLRSGKRLSSIQEKNVKKKLAKEAHDAEIHTSESIQHNSGILSKFSDNITNICAVTNKSESENNKNEGKIVDADINETNELKTEGNGMKKLAKEEDQMGRKVLRLSKRLSSKKERNVIKKLAKGANDAEIHTAESIQYNSGIFSKLSNTITNICAVTDKSESENNKNEGKIVDADINETNELKKERNGMKKLAKVADDAEIHTAESIQCNSSGVLSQLSNKIINISAVTDESESENNKNEGKIVDADINEANELKTERNGMKKFAKEEDDADIHTAESIHCSSSVTDICESENNKNEYKNVDAGINEPKELNENSVDASDETEPCLYADECKKRFRSYFSMMRHVAFFHHKERTAQMMNIQSTLRFESNAKKYKEENQRAAVYYSAV